MKTLPLIPIVVALLLLPAPGGAGADRAGAAAELDNLVARIQTKLRSGKKTEAELANEFKEFDLLLARHKGEQTDAVANILVQEASLYLRVLENSDRARQLVERLKRDFPRTAPGQNADKLLASISRYAEAKRVQGTLVVGSVLPDFEEQDLQHTTLSIAQYRGKVVLLDFGATWSKPWVAEIPNVRRVYETYQPQGFEIIGVSLDQDELRLSGFTTRNKLPWRQFFDGGGWNNKLAIKYGIQNLPANYLLDGQGKIVARNLRGKALDDAVAKTVSPRGPS